MVLDEPHRRERCTSVRWYLENDSKAETTNHVDNGRHLPQRATQENCLNITSSRKTSYVDLPSRARAHICLHPVFLGVLRRHLNSFRNHILPVLQTASLSLCLLTCYACLADFSGSSRCTRPAEPRAFLACRRRHIHKQFPFENAHY